MKDGPRGSPKLLTTASRRGRSAAVGCRAAEEYRRKVVLVRRDDSGTALGPGTRARDAHSLRAESKAASADSACHRSRNQIGYVGSLAGQPCPWSISGPCSIPPQIETQRNIASLEISWTPDGGYLACPRTAQDPQFLLTANRFKIRDGIGVNSTFFAPRLLWRSRFANWASVICYSVNFAKRSFLCRYICGAL
jgi:hypothetical protein